MAYPKLVFPSRHKIEEIPAGYRGSPYLVEPPKFEFPKAKPISPISPDGPVCPDGPDGPDGRKPKPKPGRSWSSLDPEDRIPKDTPVSSIEERREVFSRYFFEDGLVYHRSPRLMGAKESVRSLYRNGVSFSSTAVQFWVVFGVWPDQPEADPHFVALANAEGWLAPDIRYPVSAALQLEERQTPEGVDLRLPLGRDWVDFPKALRDHDQERFLDLVTEALRALKARRWETFEAERERLGLGIRDRPWWASLFTDGKTGRQVRRRVVKSWDGRPRQGGLRPTEDQMEALSAFGLWRDAQ